MGKVNWKRVLLSCLLTAIVLFGGWAIYQYVSTDKPLLAWFEEQEGIHLDQMKTDRNKLEVTVRFSQPKQFYRLYTELEEFLQGFGSSYQIEIDKEQGEYHPFWLKHSPQFMEALLHRHFSTIEQRINHLKSEGEIEAGYVVVTERGIFIFMAPAGAEEIYLHFPLLDERAEKGGRLDG